MQTKLLVVDLDKTLLRSDQSISDHTVKAFRLVKKAGILPVIATGRNTPESAYAIERTGADHYLIGMTGAYIYDFKKDAALYSSCISPESVGSIIDIMNDYDDIFFQFYADNRVFTSPKSYAMVRRCGLSAPYVELTLKTLEIIPHFEDYYAEGAHVEKLFINSLNTKALGEIKHRCSQIPNLTVFASLETAIEVLPDKVDKGRAVMALCEHLGIGRDAVVAIGDSENDIALFEAAGVKIAVQNAFDCLKERADYIVPSNDEDGVAYAINEILLKELA